MRQSVILPVGFCAWFLAAVCLVNSAFAEIEYHFVPAMDGQPSGYAQFASISPVVGPQDFEVTIAGSQVGCTPGANPLDAKAYMDKWGLGVLNPQAGSDRGVTGQVQLDGKNGGEYIRLEFPTEVRLTFLTFSSVGSIDRFRLKADSVPYDAFGDATILEISASQNNWPGHVEFPTALPFEFAKIWDIEITSSGFGDGIQLENVGVKPVPEPSTLLLCLTGFAAVGISFTRRRILARR